MTIGDWVGVGMIIECILVFLGIYLLDYKVNFIDRIHKINRSGTRDGNPPRGEIQANGEYFEYDMSPYSNEYSEENRLK